MKRRQALAMLALAPLARPKRERTAWIEFRGRDLLAACRRAAQAGVDRIIVACDGQRMLELENRGGSWVIPLGGTLVEVDL